MAIRKDLMTPEERRIFESLSESDVRKVANLYKYGCSVQSIILALNDIPASKIEFICQFVERSI